MKRGNSDSTQRFTTLVENYVKYRPGYPDKVIDILKEHAGLNDESIIADIGSGTGISTELFLKNCKRVYAIEPNQQMREKAEHLIGNYKGFNSVDGTAEATNLPGDSVDFIVSAQSFHWFNPGEAKLEFNRILKTNGHVVLIWNNRRTGSATFLRKYEALLTKFGTDYDRVNHRNTDESVFQTFFRTYQKHVVYNEQVLDFEALKGRLLSSSYIPEPGHRDYKPMLEELKWVFGKYNQAGMVKLEYDTEIYFGKIA
jgi:ubiquinone/menaquinone biosynthesis C-methylase UbiE